MDMKKWTIILFIALAVPGFGQEPVRAMLEVQGNATLAAKPTRTIVTLSIKSTADTYAGTVEGLVQRVDLLVDVLKSLKFRDQDIQTSNFRVDKNYVYVQGQRQEKGFNGVQTLKVKFDQEKELLLKVLTKAASSKADPEIAVSFDLDAKSKENLREELIRLAVRDAKRKAQLIATESGYGISGIKDISYGVSNARPPVTELAFTANRQEASATVSNFEVADLSYTDSVLIRYYIKPE